MWCVKILLVIKLKNCEPNTQEKSLNNERGKKKWKIKKVVYQQYF